MRVCVCGYLSADAHIALWRMFGGTYACVGGPTTWANGTKTWAVPVASSGQHLCAAAAHGALWRHCPLQNHDFLSLGSVVVAVEVFGAIEMPNERNALGIMLALTPPCFFTPIASSPNRASASNRSTR